MKEHEILVSKGRTDEEDAVAFILHGRDTWKNQFITKQLEREIIRRRLEEPIDLQELKEKIDRMSKQLESFLISEPIEKNKAEIVYDQLKNELEEKYLHKVVAIDVSSRSVAGVGDSFEEAYQNAFEATNKKKFYFRKVGLDYLESL